MQNDDDVKSKADVNAGLILLEKIYTNHREVLDRITDLHIEVIEQRQIQVRQQELLDEHIQGTIDNRKDIVVLQEKILEKELLISTYIKVLGGIGGVILFVAKILPAIIDYLSSHH